MILKIVDIKNPILRLKAKRVAKVDKKILSLIANMKETLEAQRDPEGVGLAAPQVGKSLQIFVISYKNSRRTIINPEILEVSGGGKRTSTKTKRSGILEGCLSLPNYYGTLRRSTRIKIKYTNENDKSITEEFKGFLAQIVEHEIDHLNGKLFIDHILAQKSPLYHFKGDEWEEVELV